MGIREVATSFHVVGIKRECLFKEYPTAFPETRENLNARIREIPQATNVEVAVYECTDEEVHPDRNERFWIGRVVHDTNAAAPIGFERVSIQNQAYVVVTYKGHIRDIGAGYEQGSAFIRENGLKQDFRSCIVETYDERFDPNSAASEMEIYIPVIGGG